MNTSALLDPACNSREATSSARRPERSGPRPAAHTRPCASTLDECQSSILELGRWLIESSYRFTTVTPETQRRINARASNQETRDLRDIFGWSRRFRPDALPQRVLHWLDCAGALRREGDWLRSGLRFSSLNQDLFAHSAYPTTAADAVFFGPDTLRFVDLILRTHATSPTPARHIVDIGCGSGAGGLAAARLWHCEGSRLVLADINPQALTMAAVNLALNGIDESLSAVEYVQSDVLNAVAGPIDLIVANPPYLADPCSRLYRDGGNVAGAIGGGLSVRIVEQSLQRLAPGGRLVLYTGTAIVAGKDLLYQALKPLLAGTAFEYREIDADVFGDELDNPAYAAVERIAAVSLIVHLPAGEQQ